MRVVHTREMPVQRSKGGNAGNYVAYLGRENMTSTAGVEYTCSRRCKKDYVGTGLIIPDGCPQFSSAIDLAEEFESTEKRCDSLVARKLNFDLPNDLSNEDALRFCKNIVPKLYPDYPATYTIHRSKKHGQENLHAHIVVGYRRWDRGKENWEAKKYRAGRGQLRKEMIAKRAILADGINDEIMRLNRTDGGDRELWTSLSYYQQFKRGLMDFLRIPSRHVGVYGTQEEREEQRQLVMEQDKKQAEYAELKTDIRFAEKLLSYKMRKRGWLEDELKAAEKLEAKQRELRAEASLDVPAPAVLEDDKIVQSPPKDWQYSDGAYVMPGDNFWVRFDRSEELLLSVEYDYDEDEWYFFGEDSSGNMVDVPVEDETIYDIVSVYEWKREKEQELSKPPEMTPEVPDIGQEIEEPDEEPEEDYNYGRGGR